MRFMHWPKVCMSVEHTQMMKQQRTVSCRRSLLSESMWMSVWGQSTSSVDVLDLLRFWWDASQTSSMAGPILRVTNGTRVIWTTVLRTGSLPLSITGIRAGGAFFTGVSECSRLGALTATTHTAAAPTAHLSIIRNAWRRLGGAVTVVTNVTGMAFTFPTVALPMTWWQKGRSKKNQIHKTVAK